MANLAPNTLVSTSNISGGTLAQISDDPTSSDGTFMTASNTAADTEAVVSFAALASGVLSGVQTFKALFEQVGGTNVPSARIDIYDGATLVHTGSAVNTNTSGTLITENFDVTGTSLEGTNGSTLRAHLVGIANSSGSPSKRSTSVLGAVGWSTRNTASVVSITPTNIVATSSLAGSIRKLGFPTTPILDDFNRASLGTNWAADAFGVSQTAPIISSNTLIDDPSAGDSAATRIESFSADQEAYITFASGSTTVGTHCLARIKHRAGDTGIHTSGYTVLVQSGNIQIYRFDDATPTLLSTVAQAVAVGDSIGIRCIGTKVEAWYKPSAGSWKLATSTTDTSYQDTGSVGIYLGSGSAALDNFGGGTVTPAGPKSITPTSINATSAVSGAIAGAPGPRAITPATVNATSSVSGNIFTGVAPPGTSTPVLDDFNRADGILTEGTTWQPDAFFNNGPMPVVTGNKLGPNAGSASNALWTARPTANQEAFMTVGSVGASGSGWHLMARFKQRENDAINAISGYTCYLTTTSISLYRFDSSAPTQIATTAKVPAVGDKFAIRCVESTIQAWYKTAAGSWVKTLETTDTTYADSGLIGILMDGTAGTVDDFGGGSLSTNKQLEILGHSYPIGDGLASPSTQRAPALVATHFGLEEANYARGGGTVTIDDFSYPGNAGWARAVYGLTARQNSSPYDKVIDYGIVWHGMNDVVQMSNNWDSRDQVIFQDSLRSVISRMVAARIFDDDDPSITYSGFSSSSIPPNQQGIGTKDHRTTANGSTITITVPADFPGGTVAVYFMGVYLNTGAEGAQWSFTVDGVSAGTFDGLGHGLIATHEPATCFCKRFTNLSAGTHTIVLTATTVTNFAWFDGWAIEAQKPPRVAVVGQMKLTSTATTGYGFYANAGSPHTPTDADVTLLESAISVVCDEFPEQVRFVSLSSLDNYANVQADGVHPNTTGHAQIASLIETALAPVPVVGSISATSTVIGSVTKVTTGAQKPLAASSINATSSVSGNVHRSRRVIPTTISAASSVAGSVHKRAAIAASNISAISTVSGNLHRGRRVVTATISAVSTVTGNVIARKSLVGNIAATSSVTGVINRGRRVATTTIIATSAVSANVRILRRVTGGIVAATSSVNGSLIATRGLVGNITATSTVSAILHRGRLIPASTITSTTIVTGSTHVDRGLTGNIVASSTVTGFVGKKFPITVNVVSTSNVSGSIHIQRGILPSNINSVSTINGSVVVRRLISSNISAISNVSGVISKAGGFVASTIEAVSTINGSIIPLRAVLPAHIVATSSITGRVGTLRPLSANISSTTVFTGNIGALKPITGAILAVSTVSATAHTSKPITGNVTAAAIISGSFGVARPISGVITVTSVVTGNVHTLKSVTGIVFATSVVSGTLNGGVSKQLAGNINSVTQTSGGLLALRLVSGNINSISTVASTPVGVLRKIKPANVNAQSTVTGILVKAGHIAFSAIMAQSVVSAIDLHVLRPLTGLIAANSTVTGQKIPLTHHISGVINSVSTISGNLTSGNAATFAGVISAISVVNGAVRRSVSINISNISCISTLSGSISKHSQFVGAINSTSTLSGGFVTLRAVGGLITATSTVVGEFKIHSNPVGNIFATSIVVGTLKTPIVFFIVELGDSNWSVRLNKHGWTAEPRSSNWSAVL